MRVDWDPKKSRSNRRMHGVSFETASLVFDDPNQLSIQDRYAGGEERWQTMGLVNGMAVLIVAHTYNADNGDEVVRIISARARRNPEKGSDIMKASDKAAAELAALSDLPDSEIDTSDVPERADWADAVRGRFLRRGSQTGAVSVKHMSDEQKAEIRQLLQRALNRYQIADQVGVTPGQVSAVRAWVTMRRELPDPAGAEGDEIVEAVETTFGLEQDLQEALRRNIAQLEPGLTIIDGDKELRVKSGGRIDILAKDRADGMVVIELKAGRADRDAIGQLLAYIGELLDEVDSVRGILVAAEFAPRAIAAARAAPNIRLVRYGIQFSFSAIELRAA